MRPEVSILGVVSSTLPFPTLRGGSHLPVMQMRGLNFTEVREPAQSHPARGWAGTAVRVWPRGTGSFLGTVLALATFSHKDSLQAQLKGNICAV